MNSETFYKQGKQNQQKKLIIIYYYFLLIMDFKFYEMIRAAKHGD